MSTCDCAGDLIVSNTMTDCIEFNSSSHVLMEEEYESLAAVITPQNPAFTSNDISC